ncbi:MAG: hypothetical protein KDC74_04215 [Flavobacteriaceae bacterium]|nr:hypothetical protein [Flavobacteriaceae bacterium]
MKKQILATVLFLFIGISFTACKNEKKDDTKEEATTDVVYQCPMDCEKGKTYEEAGKCPVCKMDLKAKEADSGEADHEHDQACNCADGEECTCPDGECKCSEETKKEMTTACKMCGDKECSCNMKKA